MRKSFLLRGYAEIESEYKRRMVMRRHHPKAKDDPILDAQFKEISQWRAASQRALLIAHRYDEVLALKSSEDLTPIQARNTALMIVALEYDLTVRQVRSIVTERSKL